MDGRLDVLLERASVGRPVAKSMLKILFGEGLVVNESLDGRTIGAL